MLDGVVREPLHVDVCEDRCATVASTRARTIRTADRSERNVRRGRRSVLQNVFDDASSQYARQVGSLQSDFDAVQAAAWAALDTPSPETLSAVTASVSALADDVSGFTDDVASTC
jgi:phage-related protein